MISICMATRNGSAYILEQIDSIRPQLSAEDEIIIVDDCSTDSTVEKLHSYKDARVKIFENHTQQGAIKSFETALQKSKGDYIFLSDQDDVWLENKIEVMRTILCQYEMVVCDCLITDDSLQLKQQSFFSINNSGKGLMKNLWRNSYMGCCMAFRREVLVRALPFPDKIPAHDSWIGAIAEKYFNVHFLNTPLLYHRRHSTNASTNGRPSRLSISKKIINRYHLISSLFTS